MSSIYSLKLNAEDVLQVIDALNARASAYEETARYLRGEANDDEFIIAEDCRDDVEAEEIAKHFRDIARSIDSQINVRC